MLTPASTTTIEREVPCVDYLDLKNESNLSLVIEKAYGADGLGILAVSNVPQIERLREKLLPLAFKYVRVIFSDDTNALVTTSLDLPISRKKSKTNMSSKMPIIALDGATVKRSSRASRITPRALFITIHNTIVQLKTKQLLRSILLLFIPISGPRVRPIHV